MLFSNDRPKWSLIGIDDDDIFVPMELETIDAEGLSLGRLFIMTDDDALLMGSSMISTEDILAPEFVGVTDLFEVSLRMLFLLRIFSGL